MPPLPKLLLLGWLFFLAFARAEQPKAPAVIIPYDSTKAPKEMQPLGYYLDYADFERLWAQTPEAATAPDPKTPQDAIFSSSLHRAVVKADRIEVDAKYTLTTRGPDWARVPFQFEHASVRSVELDGAPAAMDRGHLLVPKAGSHVVTVKYETGVKEGWKDSTWTIPSSSAAMLSLTLPDGRMKPVVNGGSPLVREGGDGPPRYTAALGNSAGIQLHLEETDRAAKAQRPQVGEATTYLSIQRGVRKAASEITYQLAEGGLKAFALLLDANYTPVRFEAPGLANWELGPPENGLRRLSFTLAEPVEFALTVQLKSEARLEDTTGRIAFPRVVAEANRSEHLMTIVTGPGVSVIPFPSAEHRRIPAPANAGKWLEPGEVTVATFASTAQAAPPELEFAAATPKRQATGQYVYQASRTKLELIASLELTFETELFSTSIQLPAESTIQSLESAAVEDWWQDGATLFLRLRNPGTGPAPLLIHLVREYPAAQDSMPLPSLGLPDFPKVTGSALVVSHAATDTALRLTEGRALVREVEPTDANKEFEILPPLVRKHGFTFDQATFTAALEMKALELQFDAISILYAQVHDTWVNLTYNLDLEVKRSAINQVSFSLPEALPEARIVSPELREVRSDVAGGLRTYHVSFQRDVLDVLNFLIQTEAPLVQGKVSLPDLTVTGPRRLDRYVILETSTADQLTRQATGLEEAPKNFVPYLPRHLQQAAVLNSTQFFRAQPAWQLALESTRLVNSAENAAVIKECEITTAIRANGEEWHRAAYRMYNRSLQFLALKLDPKAELIGVRVGERNVRADRGTVEGQDALLIPLIQTQPGETSLNIEIVYRRPSPSIAPVDRFRSLLEDPDVLGKPSEKPSVERTSWTVYVPADYSAREVAGVLEATTERERKLELARGNLEEMNRLSALSSSSQNTPEVAQRAAQNIATLSYQNESNLGGLADDGEARALLDQNRFVTAKNSSDPFGMAQAATPTAPVQQQAEPAQTQVFDFVDNADSIVTRNKTIDSNKWAQIGEVEKQYRVNDQVSIGNRAYTEQAPATKKPSKAAENKKGDFDFSTSQAKSVSKPVEAPHRSYSNYNSRAHVGGVEASQNDTDAFTPPPVVPQRLDIPSPAAVQPQLEKPSLAVNFPVEGRAYHFKKLKGDASLELIVRNESGPSRPWLWAGFLAAAVGLWTINQRFLRHSRPRSSH